MSGASRISRLSSTPAVLAAIRDAGFTGTVSLELEFPPDPGAMLSWVEEAYGSTRKLLAEAGV